MLKLLNDQCHIQSLIRLIPNSNTETKVPHKVWANWWKTITTHIYENLQCFKEKKSVPFPIPYLFPSYPPLMTLLLISWWNTEAIRRETPQVLTSKPIGSFLSAKIYCNSLKNLSHFPLQTPTPFFCFSLKQISSEELPVLTVSKFPPPFLLKLTSINPFPL